MGRCLCAAIVVLWVCQLYDSANGLTTTLRDPSDEKKVPSQPRALTVTSVTKDTAQLTWQPPSLHAEDVTEFRLQMAVFPEGEAVVHPFTNADFVGKCRTADLSCTVSPLVPGQKYRFRVRAGITGSFGLFSLPLDFNFPTVPPTPTSPTSVRTSMDSIGIAWVAPLWPDVAASSANISLLSPSVLAPVLGYEIETGLGPAAPLQFAARKESNETTYELTELKPGSLYRFRLRAWNVLGFSEWSEVAAAFTATNIPASPGNLTFSNISNSGCDLEWIAPESNGGSVTRYDVIMVSENGDKFKNARVVYVGGGGVSKTHIEGLHPGWQYGFRVRAQNGQGAGPFGAIETVRMLDPVPGRPPPPTATHITTTSLRVLFEAGETRGALIANYELATAQELTGSHVTAFNTAFRGSRQFYDLNNLAVGGCHRFRVRSISDTGTTSDWSHDGRACTLAMAPEKPLPPHVLNETTTSLTIRWSPSSERGSPIVKYHLEMMGPAQVPLSADNNQRHAPAPLSVLTRFTRVYSGTQLSYDALTLLPDTTYTFRVIAENAAGQSLTSDQSIGKTLPIVPGVPPPPALSRRTSTLLTVVWAAAPLGPWETLPVDETELQMAEGTENDSGQVALWHTVYKGVDLTYELRNLIPFSGYRFRVRSKNRVGHSEWSNALSATTSHSVPDALDSLRLVEKDPQHIVVEWDYPPSNGGEEVRLFEVQLARSKSRFERHLGESQPPPLGDWKVVQTGQRTNISLLEGLHFTNGDFFALRVRSSNVAGPSPWSAPFAVWTKPGEDGLPFPPDQVHRPALTLVSWSGCSVHWNHPDNNGAPIVRYVVEVAPLDDLVCESEHDDKPLGLKVGEDCKRLVLNLDALPRAGAYEFGCQTLSDPERKTAALLTCSLSNLEAGRKYMVRVKAANFVGFSYPSAPALLVLYPEGHGVPPTPLAPHISFADTSSVLLRWANEFESNTGTSSNVDAFDVGIASVPPALVRTLVKLDSKVRALKRQALLLTQLEQSTKLKGPPTIDDNLKFSVQAPEVNDGNGDEEMSKLDDQIQLFTQGLTYIHIHRSPFNSTKTTKDDLVFRATNLNAGGAYSFKVRGVDEKGTGDWSKAVFAALSPDVPKEPEVPVLVSATSNSLVLRITPGAPQGAAVTRTIVELSIVQDVSSGTWSRPLPLAILVSPRSNSSASLTTSTPTSFLLEVRDLPPNTPFAFRSASSNAMGDGPFGPMARYFTAYAPLFKPDPPVLVSSSSSSLSLRFATPLSKKAAEEAKRRGPAPTPAVVNSVLPDARLLNATENRYGVSAIDFLFASHQSLESASSTHSSVTYRMLMDIGEMRSFVTVCNVSTPGCVVSGLRPHISYHMRVQTVASWGASDWSDVSQGTTDSAPPDMPTEPTVEVVQKENGAGMVARISWFPPANNGNPISGFQIVAGAVPVREKTAWSVAVCARIPDLAFRQSPTSSMKPFFFWRRPNARELGGSSGFSADGFDEAAGEEGAVAFGHIPVVLVPNPFSPEALATSETLPEAALMIDKSEIREDYVEQDDPSLRFLTTVGTNITKLTFDWDFAQNGAQNSSLFMVRVRAINKKGVGALSPVARFYSAPLLDPVDLPPNQPQSPMMARAHANSLDLEWNPPTDNGAAVNMYILRMLVGDISSNGTQSFQDVFVGPETSRTVDKLVPNNKYYFYLLAHNAIGYSPPSNLVMFRTLQA